MTRNFSYNGTKLSFFPFILQHFSSDKIGHTTKTQQSANLSETVPETGWDRVKRLFEVDEFGNITSELNSVLQTACMSLLIGGIYGGTVQSKAAYEQFLKNNQATTFQTHLEAKRKLQDVVTLGFGKGAFKWGWRVTLFSCTYVSVSTLIQTYRGKYGLLEYVAGGAITGFMYKFKLGPRAWVVGGGVGSILGLVCGCATLGILKMTGLSMEEARYWQYKWKQTRNEYVRKGMEKRLEQQDFAIIKMHDDEIGEKGRSLKNLDEDTTDSQIK